MVLLSGNRPTGTNTLELDDVVLAEAVTGTAGIDRSNILESVSISDPMGLGYHTAFKSGADASYQVSATGYDRFWRAESSYLPITASGALVFAPLSNALSQSQSSNPLAGNTPVSVVRYPDATRPGISAQSSPGDAWAASTGREVRSGSWAWPTLPSSASDLPESFEAPVVSAVEAEYRMSWSRDAEGIYSAMWSNVRGQVLVSATLLDKQGAATPNLWKWAFTRYEYYPTGHLKRTLTPLSSSVTPVVTSYDIQGRVVAVSSPDEGLVRYWYDLGGRLRYRQKASQIPLNRYTYITYDGVGRTIAEGEVEISSMTQEIANTAGSEELATKVERKGWVYDDLRTGWAGRGLPDLSIIEGSGSHSNYGEANASGRLVAKYHRNPQYSLSDLSAADRLVVEFYDYDDRGRVKRVGKYLGAVSGSDDKRQSVEFQYDSTGRVARRIVDRNLAGQGSVTRSPDVDYRYSYDDKGRLTKIADGATPTATPAPLSDYTYDAQGRLTQVSLGGGDAAQINYTYHVHGQPTRIVSQSRQGVPGGALRNQYGQWLGYESPAHADVPGTSATGSYVGRITQVREQFGTDQNVLTPSPMPPQRASRSLKTANMTYDAAGRLVKNDVWVASGVSYGPEDLGTSALWAPEGTLGAQYTFDENNRLDAATIGGATPALDYVYEPGSNRLRQVTGKFKQGSTRDAGAPDNFTWTADGNLSVDNSKSKWVGYDAEGLPSYIGSGNSAAPGGENIWPLYDADGQMVSALSQVNRPGVSGPTSRVHYVRVAGAPQKEIRETWNYATSSVTGTVTVVNLIGQSAVVGRKIGSDRHYYLKNHQGSVVKVVDAEGKTLAAYDYTAYGDLRTLTDPGTRQTDKWTGKEYFEGPGLYYFGARWYDPELGMWISPDPAHEGMSPYAYLGGDPMNYIDPYGLWRFGLGITIGYDSDNGFNVGVGAAADFRKEIGIGGDASYSYNFDDGSRTLSVGVGANVDLGIVSVEAGASYTNNTRTGAVVSGYGGASAFGLGVRGGGSAYWDASGDYMGATAYGMGFLGTTSSYVGSGYEWGFGGMQGRGGFVEASAMGVKTGYSQNGGWRTSASAQLASAFVDNTGAVSVRHYGNEFTDQLSDLKQASIAPFTFAGAIYGMTSIGFGVTGSVSVDQSGMDFDSDFDFGGGITLGYSRVYAAGDIGPNDMIRTYDGASKVLFSAHERRHTRQYERYGGPGFAWKWVNGGGPSPKNPLEHEADYDPAY